MTVFVLYNEKMREIVLVTHNIRSTHNVGAFFRTGDGIGIQKIILSGYTPYPTFSGDDRLPHFADKITRQIHKTALGAESSMDFERYDLPPINQLRHDGYAIVGLEQDARSILLPNYQPPQKIALLLGNEIDGIPIEYRQKCDHLIEIPMAGQKESYNVSVAAGIALYHLAFN